MYQIDRKANNIIKLERRQFGELGFKERDHLQEWICKNPEVLGEDLLIIQKEFSGFSETNERLDLLAIDKAGDLVIIENKLDDTGRDVTWQALKYTSYCSTLTTPQIIRLYQEYLNRSGIKQDAKTSLMEFLGKEDDDLLLNDGEQRMMFVANHFRKEVTSTVLWLLNHDVRIQCFRATPYSKGDELFLQVELIIPVPETKQFMIEAKEKEREEKARGGIATHTKELLIEFWSLLKQDLEEHGIDIVQNVTPGPYFDFGSLSGGGRFAFCVGRYTNRVELRFQFDGDKKMIDAMLKHKEEIESEFGEELVWERNEGRQVSRIKHEMPVEEFQGLEGSFEDKTTWQERIDWFRESMKRFYDSVSPVWERVSQG